MIRIICDQCRTEVEPDTYGLPPTGWFTVRRASYGPEPQHYCTPRCAATAMDRLIVYPTLVPEGTDVIAPAVIDAEVPAEDGLCDCIASGHAEKPKQHGADAHAKNCAVYLTALSPAAYRAEMEARL